MSSMRINPVTGFPEPYDDGYGLSPVAGVMDPQVSNFEPDFDSDGFFSDSNRMRQDLDFNPATGEYTPIGYNDGVPLSFDGPAGPATPPNMSLLSPVTGVTGGTILNPVAVDPGMIPRVGAFEPRPMPGGEEMFSYPNVERGANVPDWMLDNPDFDPRSPSQSGMQEYTNPATGETYMGSTSSNNQYMLDPSLTGEFTPPNRSFSLESGEVSDPNLMRQEIGTVNGDLLSDIGVAPAAQGVSSFGDMSSNDMQRLLNRGSISQGSVSEVQQIIDSPQPVTPPAPVAANPIIDVLGTGNVLEPGSSNFAAPSQGDYNFGVQDTFTPPSMMSEYQSAFPQLPSFGQAMPVQQALPQGGLGSLGQTPLPLQQFNVSGSFNAPPIKSPYV